MKWNFCAFMLLMLSVICRAQDNHYSQFYANKIYLNPAFSGTDVCPRVILGFRDQWPGMTGEYVSYTASYDQSLNGIGVGLIFNGDDAGRGILKTNNVSVIISPKVRLFQDITLSFAVEAGLVQKKLDHSTLLYPNQIGPNGPLVSSVSQEIQNDISILRSDLSTGLLVYSQSVYAGYSMHHIMEPNISLIDGPNAPLYRRHTAHIGANFYLLEKDPKKRRKGLGPKISPQIIFQQQGPARELNLGMYYSKNKFTSGVYYRNEDAIVALFGVHSRKFTFGFSYDITLGKLANNTMGAIELSTSYRFNCRQKKRNPVRADCPSF